MELSYYNSIFPINLFYYACSSLSLKKSFASIITCFQSSFPTYQNSPTNILTPSLFKVFIFLTNSVCPVPNGISLYFPGTVSFKCVAKYDLFLSLCLHSHLHYIEEKHFSDYRCLDILQDMPDPHLLHMP